MCLYKEVTMQIAPINSTNFKAGQITLSKFNLEEISSHFDKIKELAEKNNVDLFINAGFRIAINISCFEIEQCLKL